MAKRSRWRQIELEDGFENDRSIPRRLRAASRKSRAKRNEFARCLRVKAIISFRRYRAGNPLTDREVVDMLTNYPECARRISQVGK